MTTDKSYSNKLLAPARVRYQCRRGMLELDVFLMKYFDNNYTQMTFSSQKLFVEFLELPDPDLFAWLMGYVGSPEIYQALVTEIRRCART